MRWKFNKIVNYIAEGAIGYIIGILIYSSIALLASESRPAFGQDLTSFAILYLVVGFLLLGYSAAAEILYKKGKDFMKAWLPVVGVGVVLLIMVAEGAMTKYTDNLMNTINLILTICSGLALASSLVAIIMVTLTHFNKSSVSVKVTLIVVKILNTVACVFLAVFGIFALIGAIDEGNVMAILQSCGYIIGSIMCCIGTWLISCSKFGYVSRIFRKNSSKTFAYAKANPSIKESLLSKQHPAIQDVEYAKRLLDKQEITAEEFEEYKSRYINGK